MVQPVKRIQEVSTQEIGINTDVEVHELIIVRKRSDLGDVESQIYEEYEAEMFIENNEENVPDEVNTSEVTPSCPIGDEILKSSEPNPDRFLTPTEDQHIDEKTQNNEETCSEFSVITGTSRLSSMPSFSSDVQLSSEFTCSEYQARFKSECDSLLKDCSKDLTKCCL